jgi:putative membrane protein
MAIESGGSGRADGRVPVVLLVLFLVAWLALAIAPHYRQDWLLENALVFVALPWLAWGYRRLRFSNLAYALLFAFGLLHELGAHYTYAEVPYEAWSRALFGSSPNDWFGLERNHFDRAVHFLYGLLLTPAIVELVDARVRPAGLWRGLLPAALVLASSAFFELVEWGAALVFGGDLGAAYLGTQGDVWDAHQDMLLAGLGSLLALPLALRRRRGAVDAPPTA